MLTISQLARHAGVTVRAVRHYHQIGLMPEAARDDSGYRVYDAAAVVRLIRIRTLADAGVPLARVQELLDAREPDFEKAVKEIDKELGKEIRRLQDHRRRIARLAAGEQLALPRSVVGYLDRLRALGIDERYIAMERDGWIMVAAQAPDQIEAFIADKHITLDNPDMLRLYQLFSVAIDWPPGHPGVVEIADILERHLITALGDGYDGNPGFDGPFANLLDAAMLESSPLSREILAELERRGWRGWTRVERIHPPSSTGVRPSA